MEELNLQALEEEYKSLKGTVAGLTERMATAENTITAAKEAAGEADNAFQSAKTAYETVKKLYEDNIKANTKEDGSFIVPVETYDSIKEQMESLRKQMETAEEEKKAKDAAVKEAEDVFSEIQTDAQKADDRMNLILTSFGASEKINRALVNEFENTYFDKIEKVQNEIGKLEELKTQINADEELRRLLFGDKEAGVEGLEEVLAQYKDAADKGPSKEVGEINKKAVKLYSTINSRLKKLGLKGASLSNEEINKMLTEKDEQGRMVIPEIDRRIAAENTKITTLEAERDSIIEVMGITLEMSKDPVNGTPELQNLQKEIEELEPIVEGAEKDFQESSDALTRLGQEKTDLTTKIEKLKAENPNYDEIIALEAELANAGTTGSLSNPEYIEMKRKIDELKTKINDTTKIDNPEYASQKAKVDEAQRDLDAEKTNMTPTVELDGDEIVDNVEYRMANDALDYAEENFEKYAEAHPEIANLYEDILNAEENKGVSEEALKEAEEKEEEAFKKLTKNYVSKTVYTDLDKADSPASKALGEYKAAELAVREAMLAYQTDPTEENKAKLEACMIAYNELAEAFKVALQESVGGKGELPSTEAIHNYLLHVLNKEKPTDKAYNIKNAENRIALLEREYRNTDKSELVEELGKSSKNLDKMLPMLLSGQVKLGGDIFKLAMQEHEAAIAKFGDDKTDIVNRLKGTGPVIDPKKLRWWQKLFSWIPREKVAYDFKAITKPAEYAAWEGAKKETTDAKLELDSDTRELSDLTKDLTEDQQAQIDALRNYDAAIDRALAELERTPEKVNKTKIERLKNKLNQEKANLAKIPAQKDAIDKTGLAEELAKLEEDIKSIPETTGDSKDVEAKRERLAELKEKNQNTAEIATAEKRMKEILEEETTEKEKNEKASQILSTKRPRLLKITSRVSLLEKIRNRFRGVTEYIRIKDAGKMSDNRKRIARTLADDTKSRAEKDAER